MKKIVLHPGLKKKLKKTVVIFRLISPLLSANPIHFLDPPPTELICPVGGVGGSNKFLQFEDIRCPASLCYCGLVLKLSQ